MCRPDREANPRGTRPGSRDVSDPRRMALGRTSRVRWGVAHVSAAVLSPSLQAATNAARSLSIAVALLAQIPEAQRLSARVASDRHGFSRAPEHTSAGTALVTLAPPLNVTLTVTFFHPLRRANQGGEIASGAAEHDTQQQQPPPHGDTICRRWRSSRSTQ